MSALQLLLLLIRIRVVSVGTMAVSVWAVPNVILLAAIGWHSFLKLPCSSCSFEPFGSK